MIKKIKTVSQARQKKTNNILHRLARKNNVASSPSVPLKIELKIAKTIRNEATQTIQQAMDSMQDGKQMDVDSALQLVEKMERSVTRNKDALVLLTRLENKDQYTLMHSIRVSSLVLSFCNTYNIPYGTTINLAMGALFHDVGKTKVPLSILNKPGKLDQQEFAIMQKHANYSAKALAHTTDLPPEAHDIALHHHERHDGTGYPHGLKGDDIEFGSKITAICDVYDAITSVRCYKGALDRVEGLRKLYEWSDSHFDKDLTYKFIRGIGVYPIGTCVRLENGLSCMVIGSTENVLQPVVRIFYNDTKQEATDVREINLSMAGIHVASYDPPKEWNTEKKHVFNTNKEVITSLH